MKLHRNGLRGALILVLALVLVAVAACGSSGGEQPAAGGGGEGSGETAPQAAEAASGPLLLVDSIVLGSKNLTGEMKAQTCVVSSRFLHGQEIVWRVKVLDPATGEGLSDEALESVQVELADGQVFDLHYGPHPKDNPTDYFWAYGWEIPQDYPSGILNYTISARAKDGRTGEFVSFNVRPALLTVLDGSIPVQAE